jgi:hypothetical protein
MIKAVPEKLHKLVFMFAMQVSQAFEYAHQSDVTHGKFDMTQVVVNDEGVDFKIINFRPYLAQTRNLDFLGEELSANATDK